MLLKKIQNRYWNLLFKLLVVAGLCGVLYREVFQLAELDQLVSLWYQHWASSEWWWIILALLLMPANWALESAKWQMLMRPFWKIKFFQALKGVLSGLVFSLFTPNRVGDYGGRILAVPANYNWYAALATLVGSYAQLLVLIGGGLLGVLYYMRFYDTGLQLLLDGFWWLGFVLLGLATCFYLNIKLLARLLKNLRIPARLERYIRYIYKLQHYSQKMLGAALMLSVLRYLTYSFQYYCMLKFFGIEAPLLGAVSGITTIFLIQSSIPLPPLAALLARGEAALVVWGVFSDHKLGILAATFSLFIINLCLPALVGIVFVVKINVLKSLGYEQKLPENDQPVPSDVVVSSLYTDTKDRAENG
jgi:hypothetical protein